MNEQTEREWFERIYQDHADMLFRLGRHLLGGQDDSALYDLMQDAFLDAWSKREKLMAHPNIGGWRCRSRTARCPPGRRPGAGACETPIRWTTRRVPPWRIRR